MVVCRILWILSLSINTGQSYNSDGTPLFFKKGDETCQIMLAYTMLSQYNKVIFYCVRRKFCERKNRYKKRSHYRSR